MQNKFIKVFAHTERGTFEGRIITDATEEEITEFIELLEGAAGGKVHGNTIMYLKLVTDNGYIILGRDLLPTTVFQIIRG